MKNHLTTIFQEMNHDLDQRIGQVSLIDYEEKDLVLNKFNETQADYPKDKCIHQLFEDQVKINPNQTAVIFENQKLTYNEL